MELEVCDVAYAATSAGLSIRVETLCDAYNFNKETHQALTRGNTYRWGLTCNQTTLGRTVDVRLKHDNTGFGPGLCISRIGITWDSKTYQRKFESGFWITSSWSTPYSLLGTVEFLENHIYWGQRFLVNRRRF